ncbi:MAG TPA: Fic family protein [Polyangia bacterium]|nr:Fic family protein [Polyangia bacterium]
MTLTETSSTQSQLAALDLLTDEMRRLMEGGSKTLLAGVWHQLDISAIYHDCALEGQVISPAELRSALDGFSVADVATLPMFTAFRSHKRALELVRELAANERTAFSLDLFHRFHELFASGADDGRGLPLRREIPLHRSYFHEIDEPQKILPDLKRLATWLNDPAERNDEHPVLFAAGFHSRFMAIFPFAETSGKVGRAMMNLLLLREGYLPAVIHATERQRYYEVLRQPGSGLIDLVIESALASTEAAARFLREAETA